jgi:hypothetical protein
MASFSPCVVPVSEIAIVPVSECRMPTVTSLSVTASAPAPASAKARPGRAPQQRRCGKAEEKSAAEMEVGVVSVARAHVSSKSFERHPADRLE